MLELTFLGTGTSNGIPVIGCDCSVCNSTNPKDTRSRTSAFVRWNGKTILIDTATELRLQARAAHLNRIDAVLYTHAHADHTGGLDDLRRFNEVAGMHLPVYAGAETARSLQERYGYAFVDHFPFYGGKPDLILNEITGPFEIGGNHIIPLPVMHGKMSVLGFRFGQLAYVTDAKYIPDTSLDLLQNLDVLVLNALRERSHPTHLSIDEAIAVAADLKPKHTWLLHLSHELSHDAASACLPRGMGIAYDGLTISVDD